MGNVIAVICFAQRARHGIRLDVAFRRLHDGRGVMDEHCFGNIPAVYNVLAGRNESYEWRLAE